ncbi:MAG: adenosylcobinamide-phosphate synthase CbiB [Actinomycetota bacterium]
MSGLTSRAAGTALGLAAARFLGEPPSGWHPVARYGSLMTALEGRLWRDDRRAGAAYAAVGVTVGMVAGRLIGSTATVVEVAAAGRELRRVATDVGARLDAGDLDEARRRLPALVGRDPSGLDESGIAAAVIESVAENSVDAVVGTIVWGVVAGAPGAAAHRAINTMDAMVGHRSERYRRFGTAAARLDDAANWVPARLFAVALVAARPERARAIADAVRSDAGRHPSPNAGVAEAAMAGALGVRLGGPLRYGDREEVRPALGTGPRPSADDVAEAIELVDRVEQLLLAALVAVAAVGALSQRRR